MFANFEIVVNIENMDLCYKWDEQHQAAQAIGVQFATISHTCCAVHDITHLAHN